jgi:fructose-bisphosphate aldolase class I
VVSTSSAAIPANLLVETVTELLAEGKGLLAIDESTSTCDRRFRALGIAETVEARRAYRELIVTTPDLGSSISGVIVSDETIRQRTFGGVRFVDVLRDAGIIVGIKVDRGSRPLALCPGERVTEGLDRLRQRLAEYAALGARFAKWRALISIGDVLPSTVCIAANAHALARYAALCQEAGLVPIVEPEVLMAGAHTIERCQDVTEGVLHAVFAELDEQCVVLEGIILKPNMVLPGPDATDQASAAEVADATVRCLLRCVPAAVPGVAFLSGGQTPVAASTHLNAMHTRFHGRLPWKVTFSFGRAIQQPALEQWHGHPDQTAAAQHVLRHRAACSQAARRGDYSAAMDLS